MASPSRIELKSAREIDLLRKAGHTAAEILLALKKQVVVGMTTQDIDVLAAKMMREKSAVPAFLNYRGYPATVCVSINEEIVHGIPGRRRLKAGDLVSMDIGMFVDGYCGDTATSFVVGAEPTPEQKKLMEAGKRSLQASIDAMRVGNRLGDVSHAMQSVTEEAGFQVVREYGGHGIGRAMHEEPHVACHGSAGTGVRLVEGMVLALEVMANAGVAGILHLGDGWTVVTADGKPSVHFEKMVALTGSGCEVLTPHGDEKA
jgi:methionyl aminopeptidase